MDAALPFLPPLLLQVAPDETLRSSNAALVAWFGVKAEAAKGRSLAEVLGDRAYAVIRRDLAAALGGQPCSFEGELECAGEGAVRDIDSRLRPVFIDHTPYVDARDRVVGLCVLISDRSDPALRVHSRAIFEAALDGMFIAGEDGCVQAVNPALCTLLGYSREDLIDLPIDRFLQTEPADLSPGPGSEGATGTEGSRAGELLSRLGDGAAGEETSAGIDLFGRRRDGETLPLNLHLTQSQERDGVRYVGLLRDLRPVRELRDQLRRSAASMVLVEERERRQLAEDLHDDIGQLLALARIKLQRLRDAVGDGSTGRGLEEIDALVKEAGSRADSLTFQLSPRILHEAGLVAATQGLAEHMRRHYALEVSVRAEGELARLDEMLASLLFRVIRELLINVARHAACESASVTIEGRPTRVRVVVRDGGVGFDVRAPRTGFGLASIRDRLTHFGGRFEIRSTPQGGTEALLDLPLRGATGAISRHLSAGRP